MTHMVCATTSKTTKNVGLTGSGADFMKFSVNKKVESATKSSEVT